MIDLTCMRCGAKLEESPYTNGFLRGMELKCEGCGRTFIEIAPGIPTGNKYNIRIENAVGVAIGSNPVVMNFK